MRENAIEFSGEELEDKMARLQELKPLLKEEKAIKDELKSLLESLALEKIVIGDNTITLSSRKGRESVDLKTLKALHPSIADEVIKKGEDYKVLNIK